MSFHLKSKNWFSKKTLVQIYLSAFFYTLVGCQSFDIKTRNDLHKGTQQARPTAADQTQSEIHTDSAATSSAVTPPVAAIQLPTPPPPPAIPIAPKIGIILGAGGAKTFAHIGFLQELIKNKVPLHSVGGIEFATPIAALYANRELGNDVEWQMFKLKDEEVIKKSLLSRFGKINDVTILKDFSNLAFNKTRAEDFKIPFACPTFNLKRNQVYLMNRGPLDQILYFCMAYPPFYQAYLGNISAIREVSSLANFLRQKGANFIVFVNVLQSPGGSKSYVSDSAIIENILWNEIAGVYNKPIQGVDATINLDTSEYDIMDFDKRREIMNKGADSAAQQLKTLTRKWGL